MYARSASGSMSREIASARNQLVKERSALRRTRRKRGELSEERAEVARDTAGHFNAGALIKIDSQLDTLRRDIDRHEDEIKRLEGVLLDHFGSEASLPSPSESEKLGRGLGLFDEVD